MKIEYNEIYKIINEMKKINIDMATSVNSIINSINELDNSNSWVGMDKDSNVSKMKNLLETKFNELDNFNSEIEILTRCINRYKDIDNMILGNK